jgi:hypothetical protein
MSLFVAVLLRALQDVMGQGSKVGPTAIEMRRAKQWIASNAKDFGSFLWICETVGIRADAVRRFAADESKRSICVLYGAKGRVVKCRA